MKRRAVLAIVVIALGVAACGGDSEEDKATSQVCDARDDIAKQVDTLERLTVSTATTSQVADSLKAIGNDLDQIADAQGDLGGERKSQVEAANKVFSSKVKSIASEVGRTQSLSGAKAQLSAAFDDLAATYEKTFAKVDCGS